MGYGEGGRTRGVSACPVRHRGAQDVIRPCDLAHRQGPYRFGVSRDQRLLGAGVAAQRVPPAANFATEVMFALVTKAGPVSTGAVPPPLTLPLVL